MTSQEIPKSPERLAILEKIAQYEREGRFDEDVENDPQAASCCRRRSSTRTGAFLRNAGGRRHLARRICISGICGAKKRSSCAKPRGWSIWPG